MLTQDYPPAVGGIQTYADCLSREWSTACADFSVMAPEGDGATQIDEGLPFDVFRIPTSSDLMRIRVRPHLIKLLKERPFDAIFTGHWYVAAAALSARKLGLVKRVFVAAHAQELRKNIMPIGLRRIYEWHRKRVLRQVDAVYPVSRYTGALLEHDGVDADKVVVVPNGTGNTRSSPDFPEQLRPPPPSPFSARKRRV